MLRVLFFLILLSQCQLALAEKYAVVVSRNVQLDVLDQNKVKDIFLKKRSFGGSTRLVPVNLLGDEPVRRVFEEKILHMQRDELNRYWISNHFQGISPPTTQASLPSIKLFIKKVDGAIGYLPIEMVNEELKIIHEF
jgi:hypothetical protein